MGGGRFYSNILVMLSLVDTPKRKSINTYKMKLILKWKFQYSINSSTDNNYLGLATDSRLSSSDHVVHTYVLCDSMTVFNNTVFFKMANEIHQNSFSHVKVSISLLNQCSETNPCIPFTLYPGFVSFYVENYNLFMTEHVQRTQQTFPLRTNKITILP